MDNFDMSVFDKKKELQKALNYTLEHYRPHDPGSYLYNKIFEFKFSQKFSEDFIELLYVTLSAWNMNSRGAKLSDFSVFSESIKEHKSDFKKLEHQKIQDLEKNKEIIKDLFDNLKVVDEGKPPLVTFSKTLHFILPDLIAPIDRRYTLRFFYGKNTESCFSSKEKQFEVFWHIETEFSKYTQKNDLNSYVDKNGWNRSIPKIMDNAVIGYISPTVEDERKAQKDKEKEKKEMIKAILASHK